MLATRESLLADAALPVDRRGVSGHPATLIVALLTIAGAWLRLSHLGAKSLWLDEGATVALARTSWRHFAWVWWHGEASLQTVYFLLMRGWMHGGLSEVWLRLPSALFGIASIPLLYMVARKLMPAGPALAGTALLTFSPAAIYYSQEARSYSLAILLVLLSTYFFVLAVECGRRRDWALWTLLGIASFYTHYFAALVVVAQAISLFFKAPPVPWRKAFVCGSLILLAALPGLSYVFRAPPENLHFLWMPRATPREIWHLAKFFGGSGVKVAVALVLWVAGVSMIFRQRRAVEAGSFWRGVLIVLWATVPAIILGMISIREPLFLQRYMVFSLPATVLLAALGMEALGKWRIGLVLVVGLCAMSLPTIVRQYRKPRENWRAASDVVLSSATTGDAVAFFPFYTRIVFDYYRDRFGLEAPPLQVFAPGFYEGGQNAGDLAAAVNRNPHQFRHVWIFVADHGTNLGDFAQGAAVKKELEAVFGAPRVRKFADIDLLQYGD